MYALLAIFAVLAIGVGAAVITSAPNVFGMVVAAAAFLIGTVLIGSAAIVSELKGLRSDLSRQ